MTDAELQEVAERALRPLLGPVGVERIEVSSGYDSDGDPALFVTARYHRGSAVPEGKTLFAAIGAIHDAFLAAGEERFTHLHHRFPDDETLEADPDEADANIASC